MFTAIFTSIALYIAYAVVYDASHYLEPGLQMWLMGGYFLLFVWCTIRLRDFYSFPVVRPEKHSITSGTKNATIR